MTKGQRVRILLVIALVMLSGLLSLLIPSSYQMLDPMERLYPIPIALGILIGGIAAWWVQKRWQLLFVYPNGRPFNTDGKLLIGVMMTICVGSLVVGISPLVNQWLGRAQSQDHEVLILSLFPGSRGRIALGFNSWRKGEDANYVEVTRGELEKLKKSPRLIISSRVGALGWEYIVSLKPAGSTPLTDRADR